MKTNYFQVTIDMINEVSAMIKDNDYHLNSELANIAFRMRQASKELCEFATRVSPKKIVQ